MIIITKSLDPTIKDFFSDVKHCETLKYKVFHHYSNVGTNHRVNTPIHKEGLESGCIKINWHSKETCIYNFMNCHISLSH